MERHVLMPAFQRSGAEVLPSASALGLFGGLLARPLAVFQRVPVAYADAGKPIRHIDIWRGESTMPLTRISLKRGKTPAYRQALMDNVYRAMRETFNVPEDDLFMTVSEHDDGNFLYGATYLGIARSDDLVIIQITAADTRTTDQKKALYRRIAERLTADPGLRPEDVFISLVEVKGENWSFGLGEAQYA